MSTASRRQASMKRLSACKPSHAPPSVPERSKTISHITPKSQTMPLSPTERQRSATDSAAMRKRSTHESVVLIRNGRLLAEADASQQLGEEHRRSIAKAVKAGRISKAEAADVETDIKVALQTGDFQELHTILQRLAGGTIPAERTTTSATGLAPQALGTLTNEQRIEIMMKVKAGEISQDEAMLFVSNCVGAPAAADDDIHLVVPGEEQSQSKPVSRMTSGSQLPRRSSSTSQLPESASKNPFAKALAPPRHAPPPVPPAKAKPHPAPAGVHPLPKPSSRHAW
eukprot:TRINITY_DN11143_c0_g1_i1.p2 TRINITY_DN11143_c0_g1~~TRINITY_DN11143_c0_g1_i1.p2  ORF type:complete len:284 (+),score=34.40 TRINITY_DN11143_c0_g1_i1:63-914(+)